MNMHGIEIIAVIACRSSFVIFDYLILYRIRAAICWLFVLLKMTVAFKLKLYSFLSRMLALSFPTLY